MIRLAVSVRGEHAELVLAELLELAPAGVEELYDPRAGTVEYAVYGAPGELPELPDLRALVGDALVEVSTSEIADDWHERWKCFHRPVLIPAPAHAPGEPIPALRVRPPWEPPHHPRIVPVGGTGSELAETGDGRPLREIVIDPGQAFGTGGHASTRLCLQLLLQLAADDGRRGTLIDVGTGSGVLAIAAAMLGFQPVLALDHERESVQAARENSAANGVQIDVRRFDLRIEQLPWSAGAPPAAAEPVVLANLLRPLLLELAASMHAPPAQLIAGGLLVHEADEIVDAFAGSLDLCERERHEHGEWAAVWLSPA